MKSSDKTNHMTKLTPKQERFVSEFLVDLNATDAARRAGYSSKTAAEMGYENLRKPHIAEAIAKAKAERSERLQIDADFVLEELVKLHKTGMGKFLSADRTRFDLAAADPDDISRLSSLKLKTRRIVGEEDQPDVEVEEVTVSVADRLKTLELIGKHVAVGSFSEKQEVVVPPRAGRFPDGALDPRSENCNWIEVARRVAFVIRTAAEMEKIAKAKTIDDDHVDRN